MDTLIYVSDYRLCFERLKAYKDLFKIIVVDNKYKAHGEIPSGYFDEIRIIDDVFNFKEYDQIFQERNIKYILSPGEDVITVGGYLRSKYNIRGLTREQAESVRNKFLMKEIVRKNGIRTCKTRIARCREDFGQFVEDVGYPIIVKPLSGYATINTFKITNNDELDSYIYKYFSAESQILMEEFITGRELHCDSIVSNGEIVFSSVGEYLYNCLDIATNGKPCASVIYPGQCENVSYVGEIKKMNQRVIESLGITNSVCHMEVFLMEDGNLCFGEIAARIGGGDIIPPCIRNSYGVDIINALVDLELDNFCLKNIKSSGPYTGFICFPSFAGTVRSISTEDDFKHIDGLVQLNISYKVGQGVKAAKDTATRAGFAIVEGYDIYELKNKLLDIYDSFILEIEEK